jgi:hypothetical protein
LAVSIGLETLQEDHAMNHAITRKLLPSIFAALLSLGSLASAQTTPAPAYETWPMLKNPFPSTGGGGVMIGGYDPVVNDGKCTTDFTAILPDGVILPNEVVFDAVERAGGILCTNGKWRAKDRSANGTTPFEVFIKDGVKRGSP